MQRLVWPTRLCAATEDARDKFSVFESYRPSCGAVTYFVVWRCPRKSAGPGSVTHRHEIFCPARPGVSEVSLEETAHFVLGADGTAEKTEPPRLLARRRQAWSRAGDRRLPRIHLGSVAQDGCSEAGSSSQHWGWKGPGDAGCCLWRETRHVWSPAGEGCALRPACLQRAGISAAELRLSLCLVSTAGCLGATVYTLSLSSICPSEGVVL